MAHLCIAQIPLNHIERIQIYMNTGRRKSLADIQKETGADYILNGTLYDLSTGAAVCHLKADGKVHCGPAYGSTGYAWNTPADFSLSALPNLTAQKDLDKQNYIACDELVPDLNPHISSSRMGKRGRSAIGIKGDCLMLYCAQNGTTAARTPPQLRSDLIADGWDTAVLLDGGNSSQCAFCEQVITSSRKVPHLILVYLKNPQGGHDMTTIHAYSKAKDGNTKLSANFKVQEFACGDGSDPIFVAPALVDVLQKIREHFKAAVTITSGYRTAVHNAKVDGAAYSQHLYGMAADIKVKGVSPKTVAAYAETLLPNSGGIGVYDTFTHIDVREIKSRWNG